MVKNMINNLTSFVLFLYAATSSVVLQSSLIDLSLGAPQFLHSGAIETHCFAAENSLLQSMEP